MPAKERQVVGPPVPDPENRSKNGPDGNEASIRTGNGSTILDTEKIGIVEQNESVAIMEKQPKPSLIFSKIKTTVPSQMVSSPILSGPTITEIPQPTNNPGMPTDGSMNHNLQQVGSSDLEKILSTHKIAYLFTGTFTNNTFHAPALPTISQVPSKGAKCECHKASSPIISATQKIAQPSFNSADRPHIGISNISNEFSSIVTSSHHPAPPSNTRSTQTINETSGKSRKRIASEPKDFVYISVTDDQNAEVESQQPVPEEYHFAAVNCAFKIETMEEELIEWITKETLVRIVLYGLRSEPINLKNHPDRMIYTFYVTDPYFASTLRYFCEKDQWVRFFSCDQLNSGTSFLFKKISQKQLLFLAHLSEHIRQTGQNKNVSFKDLIAKLRTETSDETIRSALAVESVRRNIEQLLSEEGHKIIKEMHKQYGTDFQTDSLIVQPPTSGIIEAENLNASGTSINQQELPAEVPRGALDVSMEEIQHSGGTSDILRANPSPSAPKNVKRPLPTNHSNGEKLPKIADYNGDLEEGHVELEEIREFTLVNCHFDSESITIDAKKWILEEAKIEVTIDEMSYESLKLKGSPEQHLLQFLVKNKEEATTIKRLITDKHWKSVFSCQDFKKVNPFIWHKVSRKEVHLTLLMAAFRIRCIISQEPYAHLLSYLKSKERVRTALNGKPSSDAVMKIMSEDGMLCIKDLAEELGAMGFLREFDDRAARARKYSLSFAFSSTESEESSDLGPMTRSRSLIKKQKRSLSPESTTSMLAKRQKTTENESVQSESISKSHHFIVLNIIEHRGLRSSNIFQWINRKGEEKEFVPVHPTQASMPLWPKKSRYVQTFCVVSEKEKEIIDGIIAETNWEDVFHAKSINDAQIFIWHQFDMQHLWLQILVATSSRFEQEPKSSENVMMERMYDLDFITKSLRNPEVRKLVRNVLSEDDRMRMDWISARVGVDFTNNKQRENVLKTVGDDMDRYFPAEIRALIPKLFEV